MFGKKKSAEAGETKPKAAKSARKSTASKGSSPNFFVAHAEKLILGLVVLMLGYLVYEGIGGKGYDPKREPKKLGSMAEELLNKINSNNPWPELEKERVIAHDFAKRTEEARQPSDPSLYPLPVMEVQDKGAYEKRGDPELLAPIKVIGQSVVGLIAVEAAENAVDPFEDFEDAEKLEGTKRRERERENNRRGQGSGAPGYGSGYGAETAAEPGSGAPAGMAGYGAMGQGEGQKRLFPAQYNKGFSPGGVGGMGGGYGAGGGMAGYGSMGMGMGGGLPSSSGTPGSTPTGSSLGGGPAVKQKKTLAKPIFLNVVTALVPHEEMIKEYNAKLRESASYALPRDLPIYLSFEIQRVEVTAPNQQFKEEDWQTVTDASKQLAMMKSWLPKYPQQIPDVIDPSAADRALTMPIPPILIRDYRPFVKHPDIDWAWDAGMSQMQQAPIDPAAAGKESVEGQLPGELGPVGGAAGGYGMGMGMMGMGSEAGAGYGASGAGYGGAAGYGAAGGTPSYGGEGAGAGYGMGGSMAGYGGEGAGGMAGYGMGMGSGMGMGGYGGGMGGYGMGASSRPAPYKMMRFYDQLSEKDVRKTFKYRVRVMMEDPNYPSDRFQAPPSSDMKDDVFTRVAKLRQKEDPEAEAVRNENLNARPNTPKKIYNRTKRYTPWSESSNGIYVRGTEDVFIGKFPSKRTIEPTVEAVLVKLDTQKGAYVPMYAFVTKDGKSKEQPPAFHRGAVLVMKALTTQFAHPITTVIKEWPDYGGFTGGSTVVDIRGNDPLVLGMTKDDPLTDNGEMMMLMGDGRVEITNEFDDAFWYRAFTLADEREAADKAPPASDAPTGTPGSPAGS